MSNAQAKLKESVLVTGGAGFIGSHVSEGLLKKGYEVIVLDDLSGGFAENIPQGAELIQGSVTDFHLLEALFTKFKFKHVFHLAAYAAEGLSPFIRRFNYENNLVGSVNLINCAVNHGVDRFIFTSSIAVYGPNQSPMLEAMTPTPCDPYGVSKFAVEMDLQCARELFGLKYTIFRPHNVYGERQNIGDRYRNVIGIFMNQAMQGQSMTVFGDGNQTRAFSYIADVSEPMLSCLEKEETIGEVFNIGADKPYTVLEIAQHINTAFSSKSPIRFLEPRHEPVHVYADHSKVKKFFPELPASLSLEEGIERMASWAKVHGPRKVKPFTNIEIERKLPPIWRELLQ